MWRWTADLAAGRIYTPEWHSTQVQQFSKRCPQLENCVKTDLIRCVSRARNVRASQNDAATVYMPGSTTICPVHTIPHPMPQQYRPVADIAVHGMTVFVQYDSTYPD